MQIPEVSFSKSFRGFDVQEVSDYVQSVALFEEEMNRQQAVLVEKVQALEQEVNRLREVETSLFRAMKLAEEAQKSWQEKVEKEASKVLDGAKKQAETLLATAEKDAQKAKLVIENERKQLIGQVEQEVKEQTRELKRLERIQAEIAGRQLDDLLTFCQFINRMQDRATKDPAGEVLNDLLTAIQYEAFLYDSEEPRQAESKWKNVLDFVGWLTRKGEDNGEGETRDLLSLTQMVALMSMLEGREDGEPDTVKLSTLHAAKGLEFGHVFLVGVEEGILPHRESIDGERIEEERRLMYVGITRAQKSLNISWCKKRKRAGETEICEPSRFIDELPSDDIRHFGNSNADPAASKEHGKERMAQIRAMLGQNK